MYCIFLLLPFLYQLGEQTNFVQFVQTTTLLQNFIIKYQVVYQIQQSTTLYIQITHTVVFAQTACQVQQIHDHSVFYSAANMNSVLHNQNANINM